MNHEHKDAQRVSFPGFIFPSCALCAFVVKYLKYTFSLGKVLVSRQ
jgi:hypothetical protein